MMPVYPFENARILYARALVGGVLLVLFVVAAAPRCAAGLGADPAAPLLAAITEAENALEADEHQLAESQYREALLEGWQLLGALHAAGGDLQTAREAFERAAVSAWETRRPNTSLGLVSLALGEHDEAIALLRRVSVRHPADGRSRRLLAQALVAAGRPGEAVQELEEALAASPEDLETAFALATGYLRIGRREKAEALFVELAEGRPLPQTHVLIGRTYRDFKEFEAARSSLETALALDAQVRRAHYYLGTVELAARGRDGLELALEHFREERRSFPEDGANNLHLGMALVELRRFEEALPILEAAEGWEPARVDALRFLGKGELGLGNPERAAELLRQALDEAERRRARPRQFEGIHYQLGVALRQLGAAEEASVHFAEAERYSKELVETDRNRFDRFLTDSADLDPSIASTPIAAPEIERLDPGQRAELRRRVETELTRAYLNLGILKTRQERFDRAVSLLLAGEALVPELGGLQMALGVASFNASKFDVAVRSLSRALESSPTDRELKRMLALAHFNTDAYDLAADLLQGDPELERNPSLLYAYGLALVRSGQAEKAQRVFERLVTENATWPELHVVLGQAHAQQGAFDDAERSLQRALELRPDVAEASSTLGILYLRQGRLDEAERALRSELEHHPRDLESRYHLAVVLELNRQPEVAADELRAVLAVRPDHADARYLLGKILLARGATEEAATHLEAAAALAPEDANIRYQLAQAYQRSGKVEMARDQFAIYSRLKGRGEDP